MKLSILFLFLSFISLSQWNKKSFRPYYNDFNELVGIKIGEPSSETIWSVRDVLIDGEQPNILDKRSQDSMRGVGTIISPVLDNGLFNYTASNKVCPDGWRLPRIGEWDTLMCILNHEQLLYMFPNSNGFIGYSHKLLDSTIIKKTQILKGGFWWSSTIINNKLLGIEVDEYYIWRIGYLEEGDCASVRCIKKEEE